MRIISASIATFSAALLLAGCAAESPQPDATPATAATATGNATTDSLPILMPYGWQPTWTDVGSPFGAAPALASWGAGRTDLFLQNGGQLIQKTYTTSGGWQPAGDHYWYLTSGLASDPSAVGWQNSNIDIVFRGTANNVVHYYWNGSGQWITENLSGIVAGKPTISVSPDGTRMDVFARVGNQIWHRGWGTVINNWGQWEELNLTTDSDPVAVSWGRGHVDLFYRAANGETRRYTWDNQSAPFVAYLASQTWVTQPSLGGFAKDIPAVASQSSGGLDVFVQGGDDAIYRNSIGTSGQFAGWTRMPDCTYGAPAVTKSDTLNIIVREKETHRLLHNHESYYPASAPGPVPQCCGLLNQGACSINGCDPTLGYQNGMCVACGAVNEPSCINEPQQLCNPGLGVDSGGYCRVCPTGEQTFGSFSCRLPRVLSASKHMDNGSIQMDVSLRADETGGFAIHPHATNDNQVTGFMYQVVCHVGDVEVGYSGHVDVASFLELSGPGRDDPGIQGIEGAPLASVWNTTMADWNGGIGTGNFDCSLNTQSTLAMSLDQLWATISGAYMKAYGFDDLTKGHLCIIDCSGYVGDCPSKCANGDISECGGGGSQPACGSMYGGL